jgi:transglutaminase-like putative cysteine protease
MTEAVGKRPQLTTDELQQFKWLIGGVLTLIATSTIFYMDIDAWVLMALTTLVTIASLARPTLPARVPSFAHTLAFPAIVAFFVADLWLKKELLPAMVRLDILLLLYRNVSYRQRRDDLQIIVLGLFLIVVAGVLSVSLTFAAHILVYVAGALALLLVITLSDATGKAPAPKLQTPNPPATPTWAQHADWPHLLRRLREVTDWRVIGLGAILFAGVVVVSGLLFLAIPRFQLESSMFLDRLITRKAKSGFSDRIRFGDVTEIQQDNSVAMSVDVSDQNQIPPIPYWRMVVLDRYDKETFQMSVPVLAQFERERYAAQVVGHARPRRGSTFWKFYLESGVSRYLPLLGHFERLRFSEAQTFRYSPMFAIVQLRAEPVSMLAYQVEDFELSGALPDPQFAAALVRQRERRAPDNVIDTQRVGLRGADRDVLARIAGEITAAQSVSAAEFARQAGEWLRRQHNYSLSPRIPEGAGDPLVRWIDSREAGHCELFAGSFVLLARTAGFPARVVTGFKGGTWNAFSNNFTIRNANAHAWAEIFDEAAKAWLRVDPLEASLGGEAEQQARGAAAAASRLDRSWTARIESLRVFWYRRIVSFDQQSQAQTLKAMKEATQKSGQRLREAIAGWLDAARGWLTRPWDVARVSRAVAALLALAGVVWLWREFGRVWWTRLTNRRDRGAEDPVRREAGRWLAQLTASKDRILEAGAVVPELQRLRFGPRATWTEPEKIFRRARRLLRASRRQERVTPS